MDIGRLHGTTDPELKAWTEKLFEGTSYKLNWQDDMEAYLIMSKSRIGDLIACEHCRNAVSEMEQIDAYYEELLKDYPKEKLETWNRLRGMMPSWDELHRKYGN